MLGQEKGAPETWKGIKAEKAIATVVKKVGNSIVHKVNNVSLSEKNFLIILIGHEVRSPPHL